MANKLDVRTTSMRWGNFDVVSSAPRFVASEIPTGDANFPNSAPASTALPGSMYLASRPGWFPTAVPFPAIGPDVVGGNVTGVAGFAHKIPARACYDSTTKVSGVLNFNAANCYGAEVANGLPVPVLRLLN
jgi:hypothetical protein